MALEKRVVVVGGGGLGAAAAHALYERGETDVILLERMGPAAGATGAGAGVLSHVTWDPRNIRLVQRSLQTYRRAADTPDPVDLPFRETGSVTVVDEADLDDARRIRRLLGNADVPADLVPVDEAGDLPGSDALTLPDEGHVLTCPGDGWADPHDAVRRLLGQAHVDGGVVVQWFTPVDHVEEGPRVVLRDGRAVEADHVVVAAGAWTPDLMATSDLPVPVEGYTAQAAALDWTPPEGFPLVHDGPGGIYACPTDDGRLVVGDGTRLEPRRPGLREEFDGEADRGFLEAIADAVDERIPAAAEAPVVDSWQAVEAATPDRHPLVGPDPRMEGLHLLVGGNGFGFMRAPALGESIASWILDGAPGEDTARFAPDRFEGEWGQAVEPREGFTLSAE